MHDTGAPEVETASPPRFDSLRRRVFSLPALVSLVVAAGFLLFLVTRFDVDLDATWQQVRGANPWLLVAAFAVHYTTFLFRGARWRILLRYSAQAEEGGATVPGVLYCSQLVLLGWFVNSIGWLRLGDAFRAYLYQEEHRATFSGAIGTILAERVLDVALVAVMLVVTVPFLVGLGDDGGTWTVLLVALGLALVLVVLLVVMIWARDPLLRRLPGLAGLPLPAVPHRRHGQPAPVARHHLPRPPGLGRRDGPHVPGGNGPGIRSERALDRLPDPGQLAAVPGSHPRRSRCRGVRSGRVWRCALAPSSRRPPPPWCWSTGSSPISASSSLAP